MNILDSRDLQERLDELEALDERDDDESEELTALRDLKEETDDCGWEYGIFFIDEDDFEEYAQELADDIGATNRNAPWPLNHIDWEAAADELRIDYMEAEYQGTTYLYRDA
jgi:hypothetical protein